MSKSGGMGRMEAEGSVRGLLSRNKNMRHSDSGVMGA